MHQVNRWLAHFEEWVIMISMAVMTIITFVQVVLRYAFNSGIVWAVEATTNIFAWMVLIGLAYGVREATHIGVDVWVKKLSPTGKRVTALLGAALCVAYTALLIVGSVRYEMVMYKMHIEAEDMPIQRWILLLALPIGFGLLLMRLLQLTARVWDGRQSGLLGDEAEEHIRRMRAMDNLTGKVSQ